MSKGKVYLVGSVPLSNAEQVFETVSAVLGPRIKRIPDGETGPRLDWIFWLEPIFANCPALQKSGDFFQLHAQSPKFERYTLRSGYKPQDVTFENLRINGKLIANVEEANIKVGEFAKNITFKNSIK